MVVVAQAGNGEQALAGLLAAPMSQTEGPIFREPHHSMSAELAALVWAMLYTAQEPDGVPVEL
eukprot:5221080-Lingulodinium_polyedra.AAC.1